MWIPNVEDLHLVAKLKPPTILVRTYYVYILDQGAGRPLSSTVFLYWYIASESIL